MKIKEYSKRIVFSRPFAAFLLATLSMTCIYAFVNVYPFGKSSVLLYDLNAQYVYFFEALRNTIYGEGAFLYTFSRSLGGEFGGIYAYYLASPLSYIVALFPKKYIIDAVFVILLLKTGLCAMCFSILLAKRTRLPYLANIMLSLTYALSSFSVVLQHNTMWGDGMYMLPILILGLSSLVCDKKYKLYTLSLAYTVICNYYIGYMCCIFVFIYFFWLCISESGNDGFFKRTKCFFSRLFRVGVFSLIGIGIATVILIPAYYSLTFGKTTFTNPSYDFRMKINPLLLIFKSAITSYDTIQGNGLPFIWCSTSAFFLVPFYFADKKIRIREKVASACVIAVLLFSMCFDPVDMFWHGLQGPNCLNFRYAFTFIFFILFLSAKGILNIKDRSPIYVSSVFTVLCSVFTVAKILLKDKFPLWILLVQLAFLLVWFILYLLLSLRIKKIRRFFLYIFSLMTVAELIFAGCFNIYSLKHDVGGSSRASYIGYFEKWEGADDFIHWKAQSDFFRTEKIGYRTVNDSYAQGYYGLSGSTSTLNRQTLDLLNSLGITTREHWSKYTSSMAPTDSFLGVKYLMMSTSERTDVPSHYIPVYRDEYKTIYENPYSFPLAFPVSDLIEDTELIYGGYVTDNLNILFSAIANSNAKVFKNVNNYSIRYEDCTKPSNYPCDRYIPRAGKTGKLIYTVTIPESGEAYLYFRAQSNKIEATVYINDEEFSKINTNENDALIPVKGFVGEKKEIKLEFELPISISFISPDLYTVNYGFLSKVAQNVREQGLRITDFTEDRIEGKITVKSPTKILTTIPYDEGWHLIIDGKEAEIYKELDSLIAFNMEEGEHTVTLTYFPRCYKYGIAISLTCTALFAIIIVSGNVIKRVNRKHERKVDI
ncbi:MAG: YfhO family protein [Eubacteriales bacterium]|nr:YfhO family protein [Eubacteriales bacterium]